MISRRDTLKSDTAKLTISPGKHSIYIRSPFYLYTHSLLFIYGATSIYIRSHFYLYTEPILFTSLLSSDYVPITYCTRPHADVISRAYGYNPKSIRMAVRFYLDIKDFLYGRLVGFVRYLLAVKRYDTDIWYHPSSQIRASFGRSSSS